MGPRPAGNAKGGLDSNLRLWALKWSSSREWSDRQRE